MAAAATSKEIPAAAAATGIAPKDYRTVIEILGDFGLVPSIEPEYQVHDAFSKAVGGALKLISSRKGRISCILTAKPPLLVTFFTFFFIVFRLGFLESPEESNLFGIWG